eukprot:TRINITY_DN629_c0_g1_i1.p1 TRINITY_DN629_c0_g1~~TRINITY_DN629_c0_g1_i1.p1  ORF type:complete len:398 (-),score=67.41 TRINITY_DN629_c0_g1_i1:93-1286(-)
MAQVSVSSPSVWAIETPKEIKAAIQERQLPDQTRNWFSDETSPLFDFPQKITGESVWYGEDLENDLDKWMYHLNQEEINEIDAAVHNFLSSKTPLIRLAERNSKELFPLPNFGKILREKRDAHLLNGTGLWLIRGFPIHKYNAEERSTLFLGVGSHLGAPVSQNGKGHLLGHVKDLGSDPANPDTRIYTTHERQWFHTDGCDIVGLLCVQISEAGGESSVASAHTVYNEIVSRRPDLGAVLVSDFYFDRKGEIPPGMDPFWKLPIYFKEDGKLISSTDRNFLIRTSRHPGTEPLSLDQWEVLDLIEGYSKEFALHMILQPGDMQWVHNHKIFHSREKYIDSETKRRHLLRLWLTTEHDGGWKLPEKLQVKFGGFRPDGVRTGVIVPGMEFRVPLDAE